MKKLELSLKSIAGYFDVAYQTVYDWSRKPDFPKGRKVSLRKVVYDIDEVKAWTAANDLPKRSRVKSKAGVMRQPVTKSTRHHRERSDKHVVDTYADQ